MANMIFKELSMNGVYVIESFFASDVRGCFSKIFEKDIFNNAGIDFSLNETFFSINSKNVLRGLHFQLSNPQKKLICVLQGKVWDVVVDLRPNSSTFKKWEGIELSEENHKALYIPSGFAHGFVSLEDNTIMLYQCDGAYNKETDTGILYNSPEIGIEWPVDSSLFIMSEKDRNLLSFEEYIDMTKIIE